MAARINRKHQETVREKIKASQLINRLTNHALGDLKKPMDATQVTAALGVLKKALPDLSSSEVMATIKTQESAIDLLQRGLAGKK